MQNTLLKKCLAEFIGTFAIVFGGCGAIVINQISDGAITHAGIAITFGLIVMTMIYATGHISGAHFNPAVTLGFFVTRNFPIKEIIPYWFAQCTGAIFASVLHHIFLKPVLLANDINLIINYGVTQPQGHFFLEAIVFEFFLTLMLMFVIMAVATDTRAIGEFAGLAIGGTVCFEAMFAGPFCGASMNPARSLGPALISGQWTYFYVYLIGPFLGGIVGAFLYKYFCRCEDGSCRCEAHPDAIIDPAMRK